MDTSTLLIRRQELQNRMEQRRAAVAETAASSRKTGALGLALTAGAGLLASFGSYGMIGRWVRSLLWAIAVPALLSALRRGGDSVLNQLTSALSSKHPPQS